MLAKESSRGIDDQQLAPKSEEQQHQNGQDTVESLEKRFKIQLFFAMSFALFNSRNSNQQKASNSKAEKDHEKKSAVRIKKTCLFLATHIIFSKKLQPDLESKEQQYQKERNIVRNKQKRFKVCPFFAAMVISFAAAKLAVRDVQLVRAVVVVVVVRRVITGSGKISSKSLHKEKSRDKLHATGNENNNENVQKEVENIIKGMGK